ncbi:MAG: hypothetical protein U0270_29045 [Labilithrix sp.]
MRYLIPGLMFAAALVACASDSHESKDAIGLGAESALPLRRSSIVIDGCGVDAWQRSTLANPSTRKVVNGGDLIFLCLVPQADGSIGPRDDSARARIKANAADLHSLGYRVHLALSFTDETGEVYDGQQTARFLAQPAWRARLLETLPDHLDGIDGIELDLLNLPNLAQRDVTQLVSAIDVAIRPARKLGIFVPPSISNPSDLPGGDAISRLDVAPHVDRMRIMTLDYADDYQYPGPTIDPGWAVDAVRLASTAGRPLDISYPLYGNDFGPGGLRAVTYADAIATRAPILRGPTGAPFVSWTGWNGEAHQTWFDDAESTGLALGGWAPPVLGEDVGVLFYGLGAEDPTLWDRLASRMP